MNAFADKILSRKLAVTLGALWQVISDSDIDITQTIVVGVMVAVYVASQAYVDSKAKSKPEVVKVKTLP